MKLHTLLEAPAQKINVIDMDADEFMKHMDLEMKKIADKYAHEVKQTSSRPAGPDTSKFRATVSGMIQVEHNVHVHGGQYGSPKTYKVFLKIGGGIDYKITKKIKEEVMDLVEELIDVPHNFKIPCTLYLDDQIVQMSEEDGSNWGGVGFYARKYSDYETKQRDSYDLD